MEADDRTRNDLSSALMGLLAALSRGALQRPVERTRVGLTSRRGPGDLTSMRASYPATGDDSIVRALRCFSKAEIARLASTILLY